MAQRESYREVFGSTSVLFGKTVWYFLTCSLCPNGWCDVVSQPKLRRKRCWEHIAKTHPELIEELFPESSPALNAQDDF